MAPWQGLPDVQTPLEEPEEGLEETGAAAVVVSADGVYTGATYAGVSGVELGAGATLTEATEGVGGTEVATGTGAI
jgi:hypothetical protein